MANKPYPVEEEERFAEKLGYETLIFHQIQLFYAAMSRWNDRDPNTILATIRIHDNILSLLSPYIENDPSFNIDIYHIDHNKKLNLRQKLLKRVSRCLKFLKDRGLLLTELPTQDLLEIGWLEIEKEGERQKKMGKAYKTRPPKHLAQAKKGKEAFEDALRL